MNTNLAINRSKIEFIISTFGGTNKVLLHLAIKRTSRFCEKALRHTTFDLINSSIHHDHLSSCV